MPTYFSPATFKFFRGLTRNNSRDWFHAHKAEYEAHVREPFQRLLTDLQPILAEISLHYRAEPAKVGGSLFRIHRDTRFANDKSPYKTWQGAKLFHERFRQVEAPSFHIHIRPGRCFVGSGLWHPESDTLRRVRNFILDNPAGWKAAAHAPEFRKRFALDDSEMLIRMPRGFPAEFEFAQDLRRKNFVGMRALEDDVVTGPDLLDTLQADLAGLAGFTDYLCAAVDLEF
ncbi:MAG TPA: DUF2461 domain-containing protein [Lysobacter sp.]|nr:DUF2461 domain-containing protein [Lysobacter sp.]